MIQAPPGQCPPASAPPAGPAERPDTGADRAGRARASRWALARGTPAAAAAERFAALPASVRHAWLVRHLAALRAGQVTLAELP